MLRTKDVILLIAILLIGLDSGNPKIEQDSAPQNQRRARAALDQMIAALGGKAYLSLEDSESDGRTGVFFYEKSEGSTEFHRYWQWPDKERMELTRQRDVVELTVGDAMYEITFRGARVIDPQKDQNAQAYLARRHHALEIILRQWLNQPGTALFDEGQTLAENHAVERITVINPENDAVTLAIDSATHLPVKTIFVIRNPQGYRDEIGEVYDNWKIV